MNISLSSALSSGHCALISVIGLGQITNREQSDWDFYRKAKLSSGFRFKKAFTSIS
jgi:hypothetical protein